jgi:thiol:disulfide interchange protein DsbD
MRGAGPCSTIPVMGFPVPWRRAKLAGVLVSCALAAVLGPGAAPCRAQGRVVTATATITPPATSPGGASELRVTVTIDAEWHVNAHVPSEPFLIPTELRLEAPAEVEVGDVAYPPGEERRFAFNPAKPLATYAGTITLTAPVRVKPDAPAGRAAIVRGTLRYQACNDTRCLPPDTVPVSAAIAVRAVAAGPPPAVGAGAGLLSASGGATFSPEAWFARGYLFTFAAVAALGALLNLTPCVYPLIAVTVAFFGGQGRGSRARVVGLAGVYVLGIAVTFSAMGAASALSGAAFGAALQRPAVLAFIAAALLALAGANFGLYQLRVPTALGRWAGRAGTGAAGALFMGLTMGLVAAPCVGPVVIGLLLFVGSRQDPLLGVALFFVLALGLGAPYVVLAALADSARRLPRSGGWLAWVEKLLGCVLVGLALFYLAPLLPAGLRRPRRGSTSASSRGRCANRSASPVSSAVSASRRSASRSGAWPTTATTRSPGSRSPRGRSRRRARRDGRR